MKFLYIKLHGKFTCEWKQGTCVKIGERQAMDANGITFTVHPNDEVSLV